MVSGTDPVAAAFYRRAQGPDSGGDLVAATLTRTVPLANGDHDHVLAAPVWHAMNGVAKPGMGSALVDMANEADKVVRSTPGARGLAFRPHSFGNAIGSFAMVTGYDDHEALGAALDAAATNADAQNLLARMGDTDFPAVMTNAIALTEIPLD